MAYCTENAIDYICKEILELKDYVLQYIEDENKKKDLLKSMKDNMASCILVENEIKLNSQAISEAKEKVATTEEVFNFDAVHEEIFNNLKSNENESDVLDKHPLFSSFMMDTSFFLDDDLDTSIAVAPTTLNLMDPITKCLMTDPVKNNICGHVYDRDSITTMISSRKGKGFPCPYMGCQNRAPISLENLSDALEYQEEIKRHLNRLWILHESAMNVNITELSTIDRWNFRSVETIVYLQERFMPYESWIVSASLIGDNQEAFSFYFPLLAGLSNELGARMLWAAIIVEWSNLIMKWLLMGDRPYWWIYESGYFSSLEKPILRQFSNTCESGPGTPSGHMMMNTAMFYVALVGALQLFVWDPRRYGSLKKWIITLFLVMTYILWLAIIFVSRLYIQAHFIYQCALGIIAGILIGIFSWQCKWLLNLTQIRAFLIPILLAGTTIGTFLFLHSQGFDPLWSIPLAMEHCVDRQYVKIETQPYYIIVRFTGAALGLGMGLVSEHRALTTRLPPSFIRTLLTVKGGMLVGRLASLIQSSFSKEDFHLYLTFTLGIQTVTPFIIISVLPYYLLGMTVT